MSVYVPNYKHDIFVSYAHVDNQPLPTAEHGWVTTFIISLKNFLAQKLGRPDAFSLWMDYQLRGNQPVTPDIDEQLKQSATLVFIASRGYLASHWCRLEFHTFLRQAGSSSGRLFMVEPEILPAEKKLPAFHELLGYPFWSRDPETGVVRTLGVPEPDQKYYTLLDKLAMELAECLERLQAAANPVVDDDNDLPRSAKLKKARLEGEKANLEQKINSLTTHYESISDSLQLPLPNEQRLSLTEELEQLEAEMEGLETQLADINRKLQT